MTGQVVGRERPDLAVDPIVLGELRFGILLLPRGRKRTALEGWFAAGVQRLHCLPWESDAGLRGAELLARLRTAGKAMPTKDSLIAATALDAMRAQRDALRARLAAGTEQVRVAQESVAVAEVNTAQNSSPSIRPSTSSSRRQARVTSPKRRLTSSPNP